MIESQCNKWHETECNKQMMKASEKITKSQCNKRQKVSVING